MKTDLIIISLYLLVTLFLAFMYSRKNKDYSSYFIGKDKYSSIALAATFFATVVGAGSTFYVAGEYYRTGIKFFFVLSGTYVSSFFVAIYVVPRMTKWLGSLTPGEIIAGIYSPVLQRGCGVIAAIVSIGFVAVQVHAFGYVVAFFYDFPKHYSMLLGGLFIVLYTSYGGINAVIRTDIFQFCMIFATIFILAKVTMNAAGGNNSITNEFNLLNTGLNFNKGDLILWLNFSLMCFNPSLIQRICIARNVNQAKKARLLSLFLWVIFSSLVGICGITTYLMFPNIDPKMTIPVLITNVVPVGIKGIIISGLLASIMSTADSDLNIAAVSMYKDVFQYKIDNQGLPKIRKISFALGVFAILIALSFNSMIEILLFVINCWAVTFMFPLIFGIMNWHISSKAVIYSISLAIITSVIWEIFLRQSLSVGSSIIGGLVNILSLLIFHNIQKYKIKKFKT